jgi:hypothetical protein
MDAKATDSVRGSVCALNLARYLRLLDWSSRSIHRGKARLPREVAGITRFAAARGARNSAI